MYKNSLIIVNFEIRNDVKTIAICILLNILRSKDNQTIKFAHLIKHNLRNIFLKKSYTKCGGETIPRAFSKKSKLSILLHQ